VCPSCGATDTRRKPLATANPHSEESALGFTVQTYRKRFVGSCTIDRERTQVPGTDSASSHSIVVTSAPAMLTGEINFRVYNAHMPRQRIVTAERLLLDTKRTTDFLLAYVVNCIFMSGEVVRPGEDGVAGLARGGVDALAFVWTRLRVPLQERR